MDEISVEEEQLLTWLLSHPGFADVVELLKIKAEVPRPAVISALKEVLQQGSGAEDSAGDQDRGSTEGAEDDIQIPVTKKSRLTEAALHQLPATCICFITAGLHGCGKSTLCNILAEVLGGTWLNADETALKSPPSGGTNSTAQRKLFAKEVRTVLGASVAKPDRDDSVSLVFLDRSNMLKLHRSDLLQELTWVRWKKRGGKVLLINFTHSADSFGYGADGQLSKRLSEQHVALCAGRIERRGKAHSSLFPSTKLRGFLQSTAKSAEEPKPEEVVQFDARVDVDVAQSAPEIARSVIKSLRSLDWLPNLPKDEDLQPRTDVAWQAYHRAEELLRQGQGAEGNRSQLQEEWIAQCRSVSQADREKRAHQQAQLKAAQSWARCNKEIQATSGTNGESVIWKIDLPEVKAVLSQKGMLPASIVPREKPHAVLLQLNADGTLKQVTGQNVANVNADKVSSLTEALEALEGEEIQVRMTEIVIEESVACGIIDLPGIVPCCVKYPHVLLGAKAGVADDNALELLTRVKEGYCPGATTLEMPKPRPLVGRLVKETCPPG